MHRLISFAAAILAITGSVTWAGGDDWKSKPYQLWDQNDVQQVLSNSPWVKIKSIPVTWKSDTVTAETQVDNKGGDKLSSLGPSSGACDPVSRGSACDEDPHASMGASSRPSGEDSTAPASSRGIPDARTVKYLVRWNSAQTIREALARNALLDGRTTEADAMKFVSEPPSDFEILFSGTDMSPFANLTEEQLKSSSYLEVKQSKKEIHPDRIAVKRAAGSARVNLIVFTFPRQSPDHQPFITSKDKDVEFVCKPKKFGLRVKFDLTKMVNNKGVDL